MLQINVNTFHTKRKSINSMCRKHKIDFVPVLMSVINVYFEFIMFIMS